MRNYVNIMLECMHELDDVYLGAYSKNITSITINNRLRRSLGRCKMIGGGREYRIELAGKVARDDVDLHFIKNIIMHELVHTMPYCFNHGPEFHRMAEAINRTLYYHIDTEETQENMIAAGVKPIDKKLDAKYKVVCEKCGQTLYRKRKCDLTENPRTYTCTRNNCGGHFNTYSLNPKVAIASAIWNK